MLCLIGVTLVANNCNILNKCIKYQGHVQNVRFAFILVIFVHVLPWLASV